MSRSRQERHSEELRGHILEVAEKIILDEGADALSIRRVAKELEYSVPVIYYYYRDKNQLLAAAIQEGYRKILASVKQPAPGLPPDEELRLSFQYFIESAMLVPHVYQSFLLSATAELLMDNAILGTDAEDRSPTLAKIISTLEAGIDMKIFAPCDVLLTAKVCWSAMFGLFSRMIVEPEISPEERQALIQRCFAVLLNGIKA